MESAIKVTVIVPVWNDCRRVVKCINALKNQTLPRQYYEIIVVDNGSQDGTYDVISRIDGIIALKESRTGSYAARNKALNAAKGTFVAFTDSDCIPDKNWLKNLLICSEANPGFGVIAGEMKFFIDEEHKTEEFALDYESFFSMKQEDYAKEGACITANWFSIKKVIEQHGGFNAELKSGGDHEMSKLISSNGFPVIFCKDAIVNHPARNYAEILRKRRRVIGGAWDKKKSKFKAILMYWQSLKLFCKRTIITVIRPDKPLTKRISVFRVLLAILFVSWAEITRLLMGVPSARS